MKKMLLFVNPAAGREEMRGALMDAISRFTAAGYDVTCHPTQKPRDISEVLAGRGADYDMIVTCGGDGTLNETVTGLMHLNKKPKPLLGYIPTGTVNDFATSLHIPKTIPEAVENIISGVPFTATPDYKYYAGRLAQMASRITEVYGWSEDDLLRGSQQTTLFSGDFSSRPKAPAKPAAPAPKPAPEEPAKPKKRPSLDDFF